MKTFGLCALVLTLLGGSVLLSSCQGNLGSSFPTMQQQGLTPNAGAFPGANSQGLPGSPIPAAPRPSSSNADVVFDAKHRTVSTSLQGIRFDVSLIVPPNPSPSPTALASSHASPSVPSPTSSTTPMASPSPSAPPTRSPAPSPSASFAPVHLRVTLQLHPSDAPPAPGKGASLNRVAIVEATLTSREDLNLWGLGAMRFHLPAQELPEGRQFSILFVAATPSPEPTSATGRPPLPGQSPTPGQAPSPGQLPSPANPQILSSDVDLVGRKGLVSSALTQELILQAAQKYQVVLYGDPIASPSPSPSASPAPAPPLTGGPSIVPSVMPPGH